MRRKYRVDDHFFDRINTQEKAYFLGLLFADGCNHERKGEVSLSLQARDRQLVYAFRRAVSGTGPVYRNARYSQCGRGQDQYAFRFSSRRCSSRLAELGCTARKSLILQWPRDVPARLIRHFVRGYFDGDGCICISRNNCPAASIVSSEAFALRLRDALVAAGIPANVRPCKRVFNAIVCRKEAIVRLFNYLYRRATIYLRRKRRKFEKAKARALWVKPVMTPDERQAGIRERQRDRRLRNPAKARAKDRIYRLRHREQRITYARTYRQLHPEKFTRYEAERAERMRVDLAYREARLASRRRQHLARQARQSATNP